MNSPVDISQDYIYMQRAIELAFRGFANTGINPMVGAVIVYDNRVIGEGYHERYGGNHAEINALESVSNEDRHLIKESTIYVTLEPCSHTGKTPPCANRIVKEGIKRVVVGTSDPNRIVSGRGLSYLRASGVSVEISVLKEACNQILDKFRANLSGFPYIQLKWAQSKDGYMGIPDNSIWLSNEFTRILTHKYRSIYDGILIGRGTALADNPVLDARYYNSKKPVRILLDSYLKLPSTYKLFDGSAPTWIVNTIKNETSDNLRYIQSDSQNLKDLVQLLFQLGLTSIIVEGGAEVLQSFVEAGLWHEAMVIRTNSSIDDGLNAPVLQGKLKRKFQFIDDEILIIKNEKFTNED